MNAVRLLAIVAALSGCIRGHGPLHPPDDPDAGYAPDAEDAGDDVSRSTLVAPLGLVTRPNKYGQYPPGGMEIARNVMMRDKGILRAFPDVSVYRAASLSNSYTIRRMFAAPASLLAIGNNGSTWDARWVTSGASNAISMPSGFTLSMGTARSHISEARGRYVFTNTQDPLVLDSEGDTTARFAGILSPTSIVPDPGGSSTTTNGQALANAQYVGYRAIIKRVTSDGYLLTSPPSVQQVIFNDMGATANIGLQIGFTPTQGNVIAGDVVELYRTRAATTASVGDTHYLAKGYTLTAADITATTVVMLDFALDASLGKELYTNPGQTTGALSGISRAENAPPSAYDVAKYKGTTFYATESVPAYFKTAIVGGAALTLSTNAQRTFSIGSRATTCTTTSGSAALTVVANTAGVVPGQLITCANFPAGFAFISTVVGATVTADRTANANGVGVAVTFTDRIEVNGVQNGISLPFTSTQSSYFIRKEYLEVRGPTGTYYTGVSTLPSDMLISRYRVSDGAMTLRATNGQNYTPALPEITATALTVDTDTRYNRIHWSLTDQPEAVPVLNYAYIGNGTIHRLISTRDALWVFCSDGLFRLSGAGGVWRVDPVDPTLTLAARKAVCVLGQDVWAYTNRGLVVITPEGIVTKVSEDIIGDVLPGAQLSDTWDTFMTADEKHSEVLLTIRTTTTSLTYVFNTRTSAFTTLEPSAAAGGVAIGNDAFAITEMIAYPLQDALAFGAFTGTVGADTGYFGSDTAAARFVGTGQVMRFQPLAPQGEPFSTVQFVDETWLFEGAEALSATPTFGTLSDTARTILDGGAEDRLTVGIPRAAAISQRLRPGLQLSSASQDWSMRGLSVRWVPLSAQGKR